MRRITEKQAEKTIKILESYSAITGIDCKGLIETLAGKSEKVNIQGNIEDIIERVSKITGVGVDVMKSKSRKMSVAMARSYAIYQIYELVYLDYSQLLSLRNIGSIFSIDHASVIQANRRIAQWIKSGDVITLNIHNAWLEDVNEKQQKVELA